MITLTRGWMFTLTANPASVVAWRPNFGMHTC
jgi:hypothetical protein